MLVTYSYVHEDVAYLNLGHNMTAHDEGRLHWYCWAFGDFQLLFYMQKSISQTLSNVAMLIAYRW